MVTNAWATWTQVVILTLTAFVLYLYTLETAALRRESVHQTKIALRPVVVPVFELGREPSFRVQNIGANTAFNIRVKLQELGTTCKWEYRFGSIPRLQPEKLETVPMEELIGGEQVEPVPTVWFPDRSSKERELTIGFEDIEGGKYGLKVLIHARSNRIGPQGDYDLGPVTEVHDPSPTRVVVRFFHKLLDWYE